VLEYAMNKSSDISKDLTEINDSDIEYAEQLNSIVLLKILQKL